MEHISNLADRAVRSAESMPQSAGEPGSEKRLFRVEGQLLTLEELLWKRMSEIYGHRWTSAYGEEPVGGWEVALTGVTPAMVKTGLARMAADPRYQAWPPAALEFRALCLPRSEDLGLPQEHDAFAQAVGNESGKHPAVVFTLRAMGDRAFALRRMTDREARQEFIGWWSKTVEHVIAGGEIPEPEKQIEDRPVKAAPEAVANHRAQLKELFA